jgi:hypothetical protein
MTNILGYNNLRSGYGAFVVKNITAPPKTISIFNINIPFGTTKNLLDIPGIGEEDVRISLLKGQVLNKILSGDIKIVFSDVNALSFNNNQQSFLLSSNMENGTQINTNILEYTPKRDVVLLGTIDGYNTRFMVPVGDYFIIKSSYIIVIHWNGIRQIFNSDFFVDVTSQNPNNPSAYSAIFMAIAPSPADIVIGDYYTANY